ncbi:histidine phosphatase family containing protein [Ceratobasidium sp. AG-Ba]|nr:histidine phosphatase family containing protein [Ceratobasidium sp. AG-Ba]
MGIIQGQMDTQLNQAGKEQAEVTGKALKDVNFIAAYSSDSSRAADTARAILSYHPECQLVLDPRLRERYMGSLSGTKAPARRPLPADVESSRSIGQRLSDFWNNTVLPLFVSMSSSINASSTVEPAILVVSHGATISKLIRDTLLVEQDYTATCDLSRHGIYNTSVSILRLSMTRNLGDDPGNNEEGAVDVGLISGELIAFASVSHLVKRKDIVTENADVLESQGRKQAEVTGAALKNVNFVAAYSSDLARAVDTARAILGYHEGCQLFLDRRLLTFDMGSFTGLKGPTGLPDPPDAETYEEMSKRLGDFWDNTLVPFAVHSSGSVLAAPINDKPEPSANSSLVPERAILLVSHGAAIKTLIRSTLLVERGYMAACDVSHHDIYNNGVSIIRLMTRLEPQGDGINEYKAGKVGEALRSPLVSGELIAFTSISHLTEPSDHVDWMSRRILNEIIADLKPLIGPKLAKESHIGASGLSASAMKKAGQSVVEVHRGKNYQFAYFLKPAESYDMITKTRDFVTVTAALNHPAPTERTPTPEPPKSKRAKPARKRAPKAKSRPRVSSAAKKRKRTAIDDDEEDAEMSEAAAPSGTAPTRQSARQRKIAPVQDIDEEIEVEEMATDTATQDAPLVIVKSEPDDALALANLIPISAEDETPAPLSPSPKPPSDHLVIEEEEEKPKQQLQLTYTGYMIPSRCLCVIAEPWPALPTTAQLVSQTARQRRRKSASPKPAAKSRPLFRADSDDEGEEDRPASPSRSPEPEFDSDDEEGRLRMFSQMINKVGERRSGVSARGGIDEFEDDALYGDADEEGRGI